jgi:hypothetical protein
MLKNQNVVTALFGGKPVKRPLMVTLRTDERLWEAFAEYAESKDTDRSKLLNDFMKDCIEKKD